MPGEPQDVKVTTINSTAVHVTWKPPQEKEKNGIIRGYHVHVQEIREEVKKDLKTFTFIFSEKSNIKVSFILQSKSLLNEPMRYNVMDDTILELNVTGLQPDTRYTVQVAAVTRKGDGDRSPPVTIKTPGGVPNKPTVNLKSVLISFTNTFLITVALVCFGSFQMLVL